MKKTLTGILALLSVSGAYAAETGFDKGNTFNAIEYRGELTVSCTDPNDHFNYYYSCSTEALSPSEEAKFVTDPGVDADQVALINTWENGKTVSKNSSFDSAGGKSKKSFNLWIQTLFQKPLLNYGTNKIHYALSKKGQIQREGDFVATVQSGAVRECQHAFIFESVANNCRDRYWMCQRYFSAYARCASSADER